MDVLSNDTDPDADILSVEMVILGSHGTPVINPDNTITYTPKEDYNGTDSFTYVANDGQADSNIATVTIDDP